MVILSMPLYDVHSFIMALPYMLLILKSNQRDASIVSFPRCNEASSSEVYPFRHQQAVSEAWVIPWCTDLDIVEAACLHGWVV